MIPPPAPRVTFMIPIGMPIRNFFIVLIFITDVMFYRKKYYIHKNSEVKNHFAEKIYFTICFFLLNKASLTTLFGSFISNIIIQTMRPNAITEKPKKASFSISSGAGVK